MFRNQHPNQFTRRATRLALALALFGLVGGLVLPGRYRQLFEHTTHAGGFVVDSTADAADANVGDGTCADLNGNCTLRAAIQETNASSGADSISFNLPPGTAGCDATTGVCTIAPASALPTVRGPVTIDGYTQRPCAGNAAPCSHPNTLAVGNDAVLLVELSGENAGSASGGLSFLTAGSPGTVTVRGLVINRFGQFALSLGDDDEAVVEGCFIGTDPAGNVALGNLVGIGLNAGFFGSGAPARIGGASPAQRNLMSGNSGSGVTINNRGVTTIQGNYIGTNAAGTADLGNGGYGIAGSSVSSLTMAGINVGGATATPGTGAGNVISGNGAAGVSISAQRNSTVGAVTIQGNIVGLDANGTASLANDGGGVDINDVNLDGGGGSGTLGPVTVGGTATGTRNVISNRTADPNTTPSGIVNAAKGTVIQGNYIGTDATGTLNRGNELFGVTVNYGDALIAGNRIAYSGRAGVAAPPRGLSLPPATGVSITGNSIFSNSEFGIDLNYDGTTFNDPGDADAGPNNLQNFPVLTSATSAGGTTTVTGTLNSTPSTTFTLEFFSNPACDSSGYGEGQNFLGSTTVNADGGGDANFTAVLPVTVAAGHVITSTATSPPVGADPRGSTSEFSPCLSVTTPPPAPNAPDLQAASDTGASNADNITNFTAMAFDISGVNAGATVELLRGGAAVASGTAGGTTISLADPGVPSDGTYSYTARQTTAGGTSSQSAALIVRVDTAGPSVTINQAAGQADPTASPTINFTAVFSEPVGGFGGCDVQLSGTAGATNAAVTGSGATYNVAVSGMTANGTVVATIPAGGATDVAGNANAASTSTDNSVTFNAPVAPQFISGAPPNGAAGVAYTFTFTASGSPSPAFSRTAGTLPPGLTLSASGVLSGTPTTAGNYTFTVTASNGTAPDASQQYSVRISGIPAANNDAYITAEDTVLTVAAPGVLSNDTDAAGNTLTASIVAHPAHGTLTLNPDGSFTYTPAANYNGPDGFTYRANNGTNDSNTATVRLTVHAVNDPPVAVNDSYDAPGTGALNVPAPGVLANDVDVDGNALTVVLVSGPAKGALTLNANGSFAYTPASNVSAADSFTYRASDGTLDSDVATVNINVIPQPTLGVDLTAHPSGAAVPDGSTLIAGRAICINATLRDSAGNLTNGALSFQISGANNATAVRATSAGVAQYCYTDAAGGTDMIRVTAGALFQQRTIIWQIQIAAINGRVLDSITRGGVPVMFMSLQGPGAVYGLRTDFGGSYALNNLALGGPYTLRSSDAGYYFDPVDVGNLPAGTTTVPDVLAVKATGTGGGPFIGKADLCNVVRGILSQVRNGIFSAVGTRFDDQFVAVITSFCASAPSAHALSDGAAAVSGPTLEIQPLDGIDGYHFGGMVTPQAFSIKDSYVRVELVSATNPDAQTRFSILIDESNWFRFVVTGDETALTSDDDLSHGPTGPQKLYFQARVNGVLSLTSVVYDAAQQRFLRFRHDQATNNFFFETSADGQSWNARRTIPLPPGVTPEPVLGELSAGTAQATGNPGKALFANLEAGTIAQASTVRFDAATYSVPEDGAVKTITVTRTGELSAPATVEYATTDATATDRGDYNTTIGRLRFAAGESSKTFTVLVNDDAYAEGTESLSLTLSNPAGGAGLGSPSTATLTITDNDPVTSAFNPLDATGFYVRQHYADFLSRVPDAEGLAFWSSGIDTCGSDAGCREVKRVDTSAAFFLSIEFQETGFLAHRLYRASLNRLPRYREFVRDSQELGRGVVVGQVGWEAQLEENKAAFVAEFATRADLAAAYGAMSNAQYVDALNANTGGSLSQAERDALVAGLNAAAETRATALRKVAEDADFRARETSPAFVLMQYFGYLRRDPDAAPDTDFSGYNFWLAKLNSFGGDYRRAEMVKAFISSIEYRRRFGQ